IRLRRLPDDGGPAPDDPGCADTLARLRREYVAPTEKDVVGNAALILVPSPGATPDSREWAEVCSMLLRLGAEGRLASKVGAVVHSGGEETLRAFRALLERAGSRLPDGEGTPAAPGDPAGEATAAGRRV